MPVAGTASNIRAFVHWREPAVYAGEEIECIITFKNIAKPPGQDEGEDGLQTPLANGVPRVRGAPSATHSRRGSYATGRPQSSRAPSAASSRGAPPQPVRGHRPALSLSVVNSAPRNGLHSAPLQARTPTNGGLSGKGHGRSLSIMSLGSDMASETRTTTAAAAQASRRPGKGHGRSASLQVVPRQPMHTSPVIGSAPSRQHSPLYEADTPPALPDGQGDPLPIRPPRRRPGTISAGNTPQLGRQPSYTGGATEGPAPIPDFKFPPSPPRPKQPSPQSGESRPKPTRSPSTMHSAQQRPLSPRPPDGWSGTLSNLNPVHRVMSESSADGTPRVSSEVYSRSNHSDETLASEMPEQNGRLLPKPPPSSSSSRQPSNFRQPSGAGSRPAEPETLMMGSAQTMGSFTLDGSLLNTAPFEEVKRKGVQGGGGVVGVERSKRSSGMFGAFSWNNLGESLGGLLGGDEMSSIGQMKAVAGSKSVPLLGTPQSLLFVDLRLAPGESRSYNYRFNLPRGLPPSHRGRAMKVTYHLALGVQRPDGQQGMKQIEIPFRVLGSYNSTGEALGHDLMSPYILLRDAARTKSIAPSVSSPDSTFPNFEKRDTGYPKRRGSRHGLEDFLRYTERLIEHQRATNGELLSPTTPTPSTTPGALERRQSTADLQPSSIKEIIDLAILRSNVVEGAAEKPSSEAQSANRFNIARSGQPVAVLTLLRPAYKIGESVLGTLDFTAPIPTTPSTTQAATYTVLIELETAERVDPSLALRSSSSIQRVTRKVHASTVENTLFARQIGFNLAIPTTATPGFETTGVSLVWNLRIEFTVQRQPHPHQQQQQQANRVPSQQEPSGLGISHPGQASLASAAASTVVEEGSPLLEELGTDERGTALIARERLPAETFEIAVPLRVYGAPAEVEGREFRGLVV
ncbi:Rgp1-domain-containing protein [Hortaea werneckii]|nr:Rgp1-domain-containing protein [Hortaea werneckii]KAI7495283.1 Rgp1-domain-containing protein [Hortaea werneckii]